MKSFQELLLASPYLFDLNIHSKALYSLLNQSLICHVLGQQITNLYIFVTYSDDIEQITASVTRLSSIFKRLEHLYINLRMNDTITESIILSIFDQLFQWPCLVSLELFGTSEKFQDSIRHWFLSNPQFNDSKLFLTEYSKLRFQLWL